MKNLEKMGELLENDPELKKKIIAEADRLLESKEAGDRKEAFTRAVKAELDIDLTPEDLDFINESTKELNPDELGSVSGGIVTFIAACGVVVACSFALGYLTAKLQDGTLLPES